MVVVSEFVGCSPSVSGAIRVNPWSIDAVADGIYKAIKMPQADRHLRHEKHWRYISQHTVRYWTEVRPWPAHPLLPCFCTGGPSAIVVTIEGPSGPTCSAGEVLRPSG